MHRKSTACCAVLLGLMVAGAAWAEDTRQVRVGNTTVTIDESSDTTAEPLRRLASIQRGVRETLLGASLTPDQMGEVYARLGDFATSCARLVRRNDERLQTMSIDEYFNGKVVPTLRNVGISDDEANVVRQLVNTWIDEEVNMPEDVLGSIQAEVRR